MKTELGVANLHNLQPVALEKSNAQKLVLKPNAIKCILQILKVWYIQEQGQSLFAFLGEREECRDSYRWKLWYQFNFGEAMILRMMMMILTA